MGVVSRPVQLVLLCEDQQHEVFLRRFFKEMGWELRELRVEKAPGGRGSAEQFVRRRFPVELTAHRSRGGSHVLVTMIDGDRHGDDGRRRQLDAACREAETAVRGRSERVVLAVPTRTSESWFAYLDGETVDEGRPDYPRLGRSRECQRHVDALARMCREGALREPSPSSLRIACDEYRTRLANASP
jgi:hypothetical protein